MDPDISGSARAVEREHSEEGPHDLRSGGSGDEASAPPDWLVGAIETRLVPSLLRAHPRGASDRRSRPTAAPALRDADVETLVGLLLDDDAEGCAAWVGALHDGGIDVGTLCSDLIAPAARRLGEGWSEDRCGFAAVTLGLWRLQTLVHAMGADAPAADTTATGTGRILIAAVPGGTHLLGPVMVAAAFRHAGWSVRFEAGAEASALCALVRAAPCDVVGLSIGQDRELDAARALVRSLRRASRRLDLRVVVGGPGLRDGADHAAMLGADAWAPDAGAALRVAASLLRDARAAARRRARADRAAAAPIAPGRSPVAGSGRALARRPRPPGAPRTGSGAA
ncbi:MAG: hypothetical protein RJA99_1200 [Pseudomonadota bacterium]|jgi:methanogenic corrinoid protein MtbC1